MDVSENVVGGGGDNSWPFVCSLQMSKLAGKKIRLSLKYQDGNSSDSLQYIESVAASQG
jgi:hypothetical protein